MAQANQGHTGVADVVDDYDATAVDALVNVASYSDERPSQGQWYSEVPPTGAGHKRVAVKRWFRPLTQASLHSRSACIAYGGAMK